MAQGGITDFVQGKHTDIKTHDIAEFYSVPRVLPIASEQGLEGRLSLDLTSGFNFLDAA